METKKLKEISDYMLGKRMWAIHKRIKKKNYSLRTTETSCKNCNIMLKEADEILQRHLSFGQIKNIVLLSYRILGKWKEKGAMAFLISDIIGYLKKSKERACINIDVMSCTMKDDHVHVTFGHNLVNKPKT